MNSTYTARMKTALGIPTVILILTLAGCGSSETEASDTSPSEQETAVSDLFKVGITRITPRQRAFMRYRLNAESVET